MDVANMANNWFKWNCFFSINMLPLILGKTINHWPCFFGQYRVIDLDFAKNGQTLWIFVSVCLLCFLAIYIHVVFLSWFCAVRVAVCCVCCVSCMNSSLSFRYPIIPKQHLKHTHTNHILSLETIQRYAYNRHSHNIL